jgi:hypothetical protein
LLPRKLRGVLDRPVAEGLRLAGQGHLMAGTWVARAVTRTWWPLAVLAALLSRRARRAVAAAYVLPALADWRPETGLGRLRYVAIRGADDLAYGMGVWLGCWRERTPAPLVPDLRSWPGRSMSANRPR